MTDLNSMTRLLDYSIRLPDVRASPQAGEPLAHDGLAVLRGQRLYDFGSHGLERHDHAVSRIQLGMLPVVPADLFLGRRDGGEALIKVRAHPEILPHVLTQVPLLDP